MKATKGNISRALVAGGISQSKIVRSRIRGAGGVTEGFEYIEYWKQPEELFYIKYVQRSGIYSQASYEAFSTRKIESIQKIVEILEAKSFTVEVENQTVKVTA